MPRRPTPLDPNGGPLATFALELRDLRDQMGGAAPSIDQISVRTGIARSTLYAVLRGARLPNRDVLAALVTSWGGDEVEWLRKRTRVEAQLEAARLGLQTSKPLSTHNEGAARVDDSRESELERLRTQIAKKKVEERRQGERQKDISPESQHAGDEHVTREVAEVVRSITDEEVANARKEETFRAFADELRELRQAAGSPTIRQISRRAIERGERLPAATVSDLLGGRRVPRWQTVRTYVEAVTDEADREEQVHRWRERWTRLVTDGETGGRHE